MNKFEAVLIFSPELSTKNITEEIDKFKDFITNSSGSIINEEDWGLRDLSYEIKKFKKAFYKFIQFEISGGLLNNIKTDMNQSDKLLRYLFVKVKQHQELPTKLNNEKK